MSAPTLPPSTERQTATGTLAITGTQSEMAATSGRALVSPAPRRVKRQRSLFLPLAGLAVCVAAVFGAFPKQLSAVSKSLGIGGKSNATKYLAKPAQVQELVISVTEDGNIESSANVEVRCMVAGGSKILWIVKDGAMVKKGDEVVKLDASTIEDSINTQRIAYEKALATRVQAEKDASNAAIAVIEYRDGTYLQEQKLKLADVTVAEQNLKSAKDAQVHAERMARKGFVTPLEREAKEQAVQRAQFDLDAAKTALDVLEKYTKTKTLEDLISKEEAAKAKARSEQAACDLEGAKLKRLELQLTQCVVTAPTDGMVVYSNEMGGRRPGQQTLAIEEGATVREGQSMIKLPDLQQMQVKVIVHESKISMLRPGMPAEIRIRDNKYQGQLTSVSSQPEPGGFFGSSVKEYAAIAKIEGVPTDLKPGMTAEVEIFVERIPKALTIPVTSVIGKAGSHVAWVNSSQGAERRELRVGKNNNVLIQVLEGIKPGEMVLLNPRELEAAYEMEHPIKEPDAEAAVNPAANPTVPGSPSAAAMAVQPAAPGKSAGPTGANVPSGSAAPSNMGPGGAAGAGGRGGMMARFDSDSDGKLSRAEVQAMPFPLIDRFDELDMNKDGFLSQDEMSKMRPPGGGPGGPANAGPN